MEEKKESWIETLIELFNKRVIEKWLRDEEIFNGEEDVKENILYLPNLKSFVRWLVDNDKIEWETIWNYQSRTKLRTLTHTAWLWHDAEWKSELEYIKETYLSFLREENND